ncbi:MAG: carboxymuconolactone decarboxylase family protein [Desulfobacterales bacterium]|nr:carboxymuconolactone decarboxylase family protein [Desulfobacterales bacterium]
MSQSEKPVAERMWGELLPFVKGALAEVDAEYAEFIFQEIFNRLYAREDKLDLKTRELCIIAFLTALGKPEELDIHFMVAFNLGWTYEEIRELLVLCVIPAGVPASIDALRKLKTWCENNRKTVAAGRPLRDAYADTDWGAQGHMTGEALFGAGEWNRYHGDLAQMDTDLAAFMAENFVGRLLTRDGLDRRTRQLCLVAAFAALKSTVHLKLHIHGALNSGANMDEIKEILYQVGIYAGQEAVSHGVAVCRSIAR